MVGPKEEKEIEAKAEILADIGCLLENAILKHLPELKAELPADSIKILEDVMEWRRKIARQEID